MSPPACELLYCGTIGTPCHDDTICDIALQCHKGRCNPCDLCGGLCEVDFDTDPDHCGCCNRAIPDGGICDSGTPECGQGLTPCDGVCRDLNTDVNHCGSCGNVLPAGVECDGGSPGCLDPQETICDGVGCVDLDSDSDNCGACGNSLPSSVECMNGSPGCAAPGETVCEGAGCVNLNNSDDHCGACSASCGAGSLCGGNGCCRRFSEGDVPDTCANICAAAGLTCTPSCLSSSQALYSGWCATDQLRIDSCTSLPPSTGLCAGCTCELWTTECYCSA